MIANTNRLANIFDCTNEQLSFMRMRKTFGHLALWAGLSVAMSMYNKWILDRMAFNFPLTLTLAHMAGAALVMNVHVTRQRHKAALELTQACAACKVKGPRLDAKATTESVCGQEVPVQNPNLADVDGTNWPDRQIQWFRRYGTYLVPIAAALAAGVCLKNSAFATMPIPTMQLIAASSPLGTYALSVVFGLAPFTLARLICLVGIVVGVLMATDGRPAMLFHSGGAMRFAGGMALDIFRVVLLQALIHKIESKENRARQASIAHGCMPDECDALETGTQHQSKRTPTKSLALSTILLGAYAPACALMLLLPAAFIEGKPALTDLASRPVSLGIALGGNVTIAVALNLVAVTCLHGAGVVALSLTGFVKDWALILMSALTFGDGITPRFGAGMLTSTAAVAAYAVACTVTPCYK